MREEIGYETMATVLETWDAARRTGKDGFESEFGKLLVDKEVVNSDSCWRTYH